MPAGIVLFAHGARDPRWAEPFEALAVRLRQLRPQAEVRLAYLELMQPSLPAAGDALASAGCDSVEVVPVFLGAGGHVRRDLPLLIEALRERHAGIRWTLHAPLGETPSVIDAMAATAAATLGTRP
ncbi:MAG TPA: CbiX/SirB N-terminal domain-containing protein [Rubrivivax sp.]